MTGKVFPETSNIYQDQAKVLFDYYKAAAEKIVNEEMAIERNQEDLKKQIADADAIINRAEKMKPIYYILAGALGVIGIVFFFFMGPIGLILGVCGAAVVLAIAFKNHKSMLTSQEQKKLCQNQLMEMIERYQNIRRDYAVDSIGVAYVPVATRVPFEGKSLLIDHTHSVENKDFHLTVLHQPKEFEKSVENLHESLKNLPVVEDNQMPESVNTSDYSLSVQNITLHDYVGNIDRQVRNISYLLGDSEEVSVEIPAIEPQSKEAAFINEYATNDTAGKPVVSAFDINYEDKLNRFTSLNASKNQFSDSEEGRDSNTYLKQMISQLAESVSILSKTKNAGASNMMNYTSGILATVLKAGYNQYSPQMEAEEIERIRTTTFDYKTDVNDYTPFNLKKSSEMKYDIFSENWVADDGSRTIRPFGMHQIDEEVLQPIISSLMSENRVERLRIYSDIEDQKRMYLDRWSSEIGNYYRDNRAACDDLINQMRETYSEYVSSMSMYQSLMDTMNLMKSTEKLESSEVKEKDTEMETIAGFEQQAAICNEKQQSFAEYMDRIQEQINTMTDDFSHIKYYEGALRDSVSHDVAVAMSNILQLDDRRKQLLGISPYIANFAELPPQPRTTDSMMEDVSIDLEEQAKEQLQMIEEHAQQSPEAQQSPDAE